MIKESFIFVVLFNSFLFLLALDFAVLFLIVGLFLGNDLFVFLVFDFEAVLSGLVDIGPHIADDFGDFCDFGSGIIGFDSVVDLSSVEEKGREGALGSGWLNRNKVTLSEISFLPIIYNLLIVPLFN